MDEKVRRSSLRIYENKYFTQVRQLFVKVSSNILVNVGEWRVI